MFFTIMKHQDPIWGEDWSYSLYQTVPLSQEICAQPPSFISLSPLSLADRCDWHDTWGKIFTFCGIIVTNQNYSCNVSQGRCSEVAEVQLRILHNGNIKVFTFCGIFQPLTTLLWRQLIHILTLILWTLCIYTLIKSVYHHIRWLNVII